MFFKWGWKRGVEVREVYMGCLGYSRTSNFLDDPDFDWHKFLFFQLLQLQLHNECTNEHTNKPTNQFTNEPTNKPTRLLVLFMKYTLCSFYHKYKLCEYGNVLIEILVAVKIFIVWYLSHLSICLQHKLCWGKRILFYYFHLYILASVHVSPYRIMKRKFKQWWSTIPTISTKQTTISYFKSLRKKDMTSRSWLRTDTKTVLVMSPGPPAQDQ